MYIKKIKVKNFKCFEENEIEFSIPNGKEGSGLNIFVGENNSGKSSLFEAIHFIRNQSKKDVRKIGKDDGNEFYVEQTFVGNIEHNIDNFVQDNKKESFKKCLIKEDGKICFKVKRDFKNESEAKKILFMEDGVYRNSTGIDGVFQKFFQISNIWADTNPENESKFGSTTICGNLLADISEKFKTDNKEYDNFLLEFNKMFNDDSSGLQLDLNKVASETEEILNEQFGSAKLKFKFNNPEPNILFKNIQILVNDGEETDISEKGHGLQRAVILSLLQVYAKRITQIEDGEGNVVIKPHFLFIDEPEMGLHPQAQKKLFNALKVLSKTHQIFINTHSENFISLDVIENIYKFNNKDDKITINSVKNFDIDLRENRNFFFHHHKIFFTNKAIFVEGIDDYERYPIFCELNNYKELKKDFYLMNGCSAHKKFREFCDYFGIKSYFI
ncbi:AAA family ATPase, partial [Candidatus Gracilibacteria bacterium]|nr:AAA family ATPase [Candidatus Gracilibacteria bacterium]